MVLQPTAWRSPWSVCHLSVLLSLLLAVHVGAATTWYVNGSVASGGRGRSWGQAFRSLQQALDVASPGDSIWVAAGVYEPEHVREIEGEFAFASSFELKDGVSIVGGFRGDETTIGQRELAADGLYAWEFRHRTVLRQQEGVIGSVMRTGTATLERGVSLNGLVLERGRALGTWLDGNGGALQGAGRLTLTACLLQGNLARNGGAIYWEGALTVQSCGFFDNDLVVEGWSGVGGAITALGDGFRLTGVVCAGNGTVTKGVQSGGALFLDGQGLAEHCTLVQNQAVRNASGVWLAGGATLLNSLIWGNMGASSQLLAEQSSVAFCAVQHLSVEGLGNIPLLAENAGPNGLEANDNWVDGYYPCLQDPQGRDFRLAPGSYLLNRGHLEDTSAPILDATGQDVRLCLPADIGACASTLRGNLALDFSADYPYIYGASSPLLVYLGYGTPSQTSAFLVASEEYVDLEQNSPYEWLATWLRSGTVSLSLIAEVTGDEASYWNTFLLTRPLQVTPRPLVIAAEDTERRLGDEGTQEFGWSIIAGRLVQGDTITGQLACDYDHTIGATAAITQGTLAVNDGNGGQNYRLTFHDGLLTCLKGLAEFDVASETATYTGQPLSPAVTTTPGDLATTIVYEGTDGTDYPASDQPPTHVGSYLVTVTVQDDSYEGEVTFPFTITPAPLTVTADDQTRPYGQANPTLTLAVTGLLGQDTIQDITLPDLATTATPDSPVVADGYPITLSGGSARNYALKRVPGTLTITRAVPDGAAQPEATSITYGDALASSTLTAPARCVVSGAYRWHTPDAIPNAGVQSHSWTFHPEDTTNYATLTGTTAVTVARRPLTVTTQAADILYGDADPTFAVTVTSGSLVTGDRLTGQPAREAGSDVGTYRTSVGSLSVGDNYALDFIPGTLRISPRPVTLAAKDVSRFIGQPDPELGWSLTSGTLVQGDQPSGALVRAAGEAPGTYAITQGTLRLSDNYSLTFQPGTFTISRVIPQCQADSIVVTPITYGDSLASAAITGTVTNPVSGETIPGTFSWNAPTTHPDAGSSQHDWTFTPADAASYPTISGSATLTVRPAVLTASLELDAYQRPYLTENPEFRVILSGFVNGDTADSAVTISPLPRTAATQASIPGQYPVTLSSGLAANYTFSYQNATLSIVNATPTSSGPILASDITFGQDASQSQLSGTFVDANFNVVPGQLSWCQTTPERPTPGTLQRQWQFVPASPYFNSVSGSVTVSVNRAILTITADSVSILRGEPIPEFTLSFAGLVNGDDPHDPSVIQTLPTISCQADAASAPGTYPITLSGGQAANYQLKLVSGTLTIAGYEPVFCSLNNEMTFTYGHDFSRELSTNSFIINSDIDNSVPPDIMPNAFVFNPTLIETDPNRPVTYILSISNIQQEEYNYIYFTHPKTGMPVSGRLVLQDPLEWLDWVQSEDFKDLYYDYARLTNTGDITPIFDGHLPVGFYPSFPWTFYPDEKYTDLVPYTGFSKLIVKPRCVYVYANENKAPTYITYTGQVGEYKLMDWYYTPKDLVMEGTKPGGYLFFELTGNPSKDIGSHSWACTKACFITDGFVNKNYEIVNRGGIGGTAYVVPQEVGTVRFLSQVTRSLSSEPKPLMASSTHPDIAPNDFTVTQPVRESGKSYGRYRYLSFKSCVYNYGFAFTLEQSIPAYLYFVGSSSTYHAEVDSHIITYGDPLPALTVTPLRLDGKENVSGVTGEPELEEPVTGVGTYTIGIGTVGVIVGNNTYANNHNYVTIFPGTLTVRPRPLTVRLKVASKIQGQDDPTPSWEIVEGSLINGDTLSGAFEREPGEEPGAYAYTLGTFGHPNYDITLIGDSHLVIEPMNGLEWDFSGLAASSVVYGQSLSTSAITGTLTHPVTGEAIAGIWQWLTPDYRIVQDGQECYAQFTPEGTALTEELPPIPFIVPMVPYTVSVQLHSHGILWGDALPKLTYSHTPLLEGEYLSGEPAAVWDASQGCYRITPGTLAAPHEHCQLVFTNPNPVITVAKRKLALQVNNVSKKIGEDDPSFTYRLISGSLAAGDEITDISFEREPGEEPGAYAISISSLSTVLDPEMQHYTLTLLPGALTISEDGAPSDQTARVIAASSWANQYQPGDIVEWEGEQYLYGTNAFSNLIEAIQAVRPGGVVQLAPEQFMNTNAGNIINITKPLSIIGSVAEDGTIPEIINQFRLMDSRVTHFNLSGVKLSYGYTVLPAMYISKGVGHVTIANSIISSNGPGIIINDYSGSVTLLNNQFMNMNASGRGLAIVCNHDAWQNYPDMPVLAIGNDFTDMMNPYTLNGFSIIATENVNEFGPLEDLFLLEPGHDVFPY